MELTDTEVIAALDWLSKQDTANTIFVSYFSGSKRWSATARNYNTGLAEPNERTKHIAIGDTVSEALHNLAEDILDWKNNHVRA